MNVAARDMLCGGCGLALAALYYRLADALPVSLLSDGIGADGVPKLLAAALALCSALLIARAALLGRTAPGRSATAAPAHARSLGVIGLGAAYALVAPAIGYAPALALLLAATALYFGAALSLRLALVAALGAALFWALFVRMLGVAMPQGSLLRLLT